MKQFIVEEPFWELFPKAKIGVIILQDLDNSIKNLDQYRQMLFEAKKLSLKHLPNDEFSSNEVIKIWRNAFQQFKTKKGARSSIEALLKRAHKGDPLDPVNPLVDIYNSISLQYAMPCGGEDIDTFAGHLRLTRAVGNEVFITLGTDESAPPYEGELIYKDDAGAVCRCWNWRESVRTMLTEKTRNAFLCIEQVDGSRLDKLQQALGELAKTAELNLGGQYRIDILDQNNRQVPIE